MEIKKGMYVRTTYGIGKITDIYIIYTDDGAFWYVSCMTDKYIPNRGYIQLGIFADDETYGPEGNYLRITSRGHIMKAPLYEEYETSKYKGVVDDYLKERDIEYVCYINHTNNAPRGSASIYDDHKFIDMKDELIDLIGKGDIITYEFPTGLGMLKHENVTILLPELLNIFKNDKKKEFTIVSIVTKEQFERERYEVK